MNQQFLVFLFSLKTVHTFCLLLPVCVLVSPKHSSEYLSTAAGVTSGNVSPEYFCVHYPWHWRTPGTSAETVSLFKWMLCVWARNLLCFPRVSISHNVMADWPSWRASQALQVQSYSALSVPLSPSSSPWLNSPRLSAAAMQLLYFHPTSSHDSLRIAHLVSSLSLAASLHLLIHPCSWLLYREICFYTIMLNRIDDHAH